MIGLHRSQNRSRHEDKADLEKVSEIKRRAQRCILNGDLDGALSEYEKLLATGDSDPYHSVLLADLLYKKSDHGGAARRYLEAVDGYQQMGLYKNAIAVCKKMSRLALAPEAGLKHLASLHALDGLATESTLYYMQHADLVLQRKDTVQAMDSLRSAFQVCPDNVKALERLAEVQEQSGAAEDVVNTLLEAAGHYERVGQLTDAKRCRNRAAELMPGGGSEAGRLAAPFPAGAAHADDSRESAMEGPGNAAPDSAVAVGGPSVSAAVATPLAPRPADVDPALATRMLADEAECGLSLGIAEDASTMGSAPEMVDGCTSVMESAVPADAAAPVDAVREGDASSTPARPGLGFDAPASDSGTAASAGGAGLPEVSVLLNEAQILFDRGERVAARATLVRAAQAYDRLGRFDNAASIYRSLSPVREAPLQVMMLWLKNCQRRDDLSEASRVACELGDRALVEGDSAGAREWFERARAFDDSNEAAEQRLERLLQSTGTSPVSTVAESTRPETDERTDLPAPETGDAAAEVESTAGIPAPPMSFARTDRGMVEISFSREESVAIDLGEVIAEFRRTLEAQLASDTQGHYDLGMSYREMGLFEEAVASFELAAHEPALRVRATEMIGRCMLDRGDFDEAARYLQAAIEMPELNPEAALDLVFQLGLALEAGGRLEEASEEFESIYSEEPSYPDVAQKIRALRKALEKD